jgi:hypothetical protein
MRAVCEHLGHLWIKEHFRRALSGRMEMDGREIICGTCGDIWECRSREQLPLWLQQQLRDQGL